MQLMSAKVVIVAHMAICTQANDNPLTDNLLDIYVGVYSPIKLDNGQHWIENSSL
ncbi:hypothetical protein [Silvimonas sp.]|nr:hypothetical protein [Silvimonas sp.]MDR3426292.1 hypothetical protein [Silvimonas sp.]